MRVEKERQSRRELVDLQPGVERGLDVGDAVRQRERDLLRCGRAGFADVVAGDRDRVPVRDLLCAISEDVGYDSQAGARGVDVCSASDVLLQNVVLYSAVEFVRRGALP